MTDKKKTPPDNTGKKYDLTITDKQIKFIDLYLYYTNLKNNNNKL